MTKKRWQRPVPRFRGYPVATVSLYGPTPEQATKVVVRIVPERDAQEIAREWVSEESDIRFDTGVAHQVSVFIGHHRVQSMMLHDEIMGCPHEADRDYPTGESCPYCIYWKDHAHHSRQMQIPN